MRTPYSVVFRFSPDSLTWLVSRERTVVSRYCRKRDAVREATRLARAATRAELTVERMDGTVEWVRHYGPSTGPRKAGGATRGHPPKGDGRASRDGDSVAV
ncbi:hypothetical protein SZMC14600_17645 [Saccharomonospora azurea SZMC 14600]|uniref:DUF2188 domain-containing protein n=1 Tax=Saccharomonospora azurea TaxID=40988 RepID=UPI00023FEA9C|nr:DUF2188 domain-containing protein [Saccharomonospora azurea]EHK84825.1 hypothetical protein SZMC14600_17645 [Saccharomonospora azurea SZMC 14600]